MKIKDIKKAAYNPRKMNRETKKALKVSIDEFDDISGITVNSRTGNIVAGNHRWIELCEKHGKSNLSLEHIIGEFFSLNSLEEFTGFLVRVVDWPIEKEMAANVTANSDLVAGEFTSNLQDVLSKASEGLSEKLFVGLRMEELQIDFGDSDDYLDLGDNSDIIREQAEKNNRALDDANGVEGEPVKEIRSLIKVSIPSELRDEVMSDLLDYLSKQKYYDELTIV